MEYLNKQLYTEYQNEFPELQRKGLKPIESAMRYKAMLFALSVT